MNKSIAAIGVTKQVDKATVATAPAYWHGVNSGKMATVEVTDEVLEVTTQIAAAALVNRTQADLPTGFKTLSFRNAVGLYLLGVLGDVGTTGAAAPYTHVFTMADALPWLTFFSELDAWLQANGASKISELSFEWDGPKPLWITVVANGCTMSLPASIAPPVADEILGEFFTPVGGTFQGDVDGSTLADWSIFGGKITFKRANTVDYFCTAITPGDIGDGALQTSVELKVRVADFDDWRTIVTGAADGTTIAGAPVVGSFSMEFVNNTDSLTFAAGRVMYSASPMEPDPKGGGFDLSLKGECLAEDSTTSPITATLVNGVAAY